MNFPIELIVYLNLAFFHELYDFPQLCDRMRFEVNCAKSHHCIISDGSVQCTCSYKGKDKEAFSISKASFFTQLHL